MSRANTKACRLPDHYLKEKSVRTDIQADSRCFMSTQFHVLHFAVLTVSVFEVC